MIGEVVESGTTATAEASYTIGGDEFKLGGAGGGAFGAGPYQVVNLGNNTYRYLLNGDFTPGAVTVIQRAAPSGTSCLGSNPRTSV